MKIIHKSITTFITISLLISVGMTALVKANNQADAGILLSEGKLDEAESVLNKSISVDDKDIVSLSLLGEVYRKKGQYNKAMKLLDRAILLDAKYPVAYIYKGKLYFSMQKFEDVAAEFTVYMEKMRPLATDDVTRQSYVARLHEISTIYFELKKYAELRIVLNEILRLAPRDQAALYNLGIYYYTYERNRSMAYNNFMKVIEIDPLGQPAAKARYAIEFMRANPDPRVVPDFSFIDQEFAR